jgi:molybdopterin-binding protein
MTAMQLLKPREAAKALGISYPTLKHWIYHGKLRTVKTPGGHHRVPTSELDRWLPRAKESPALRRSFRRISGRNQLVGKVVDVQVEGLLAQVKLSIGGQRINSIITAEAAREMNLQKGDTVAALIKSTEVMLIRP